MYIDLTYFIYLYRFNFFYLSLLLFTIMIEIKWVSMANRGVTVKTF